MAENKISRNLDDLEEKVLECTICFKRLQQPKSLSCLHSFCMQCLQDWVKAKGELTCPTCSRTYPIPDDGLQKLPPNTFINNLLESIEKMEETEKLECNCEKRIKATYYCQECRQYLCSNCCDHHKRFPALTSHILHTIEDVRSMTPLQFSSLHRQQCSLHNEPLRFYCKNCKTVICMHCAITDHNVGDGSHKPISISEAYNEFKKNAFELTENANQYITTAQAGLTKHLRDAELLNKNKEICSKDIDNHVKEMVQIIKRKGEQLKQKVENEHGKKKNKKDFEIHELRKTISDVETKLNFLGQLLKTDEATSLQSSVTVIAALKETIKQPQHSFYEEDTTNNEEIHFFQNKHQISELKKHGIGNVSEKRVAHCLRIEGKRQIYATQYQTISVKLVKTEKCKICVNQLKATLTESTGVTTNLTQVEEDNGNYLVKLVCTSIDVFKLAVSIDGESIQQSPMTITVEEVDKLVNTDGEPSKQSPIMKAVDEEDNLVNTIKVDKKVTGVVWCEEDDCLLVSFGRDEIFKYRISGEYIGKITLQKGVSVNRMYRMKNGNLAFSDNGDDQCIKICRMNGHIIKTIGKGVLNHPSGVEANDESTIIYAAGFSNTRVHMFGIDNNVVKKISGTYAKQKGHNDITLTKDGNVLVTNYIYSRLELFEEQFMKVLVGPIWVTKPGGVVVDDDDNIILSSIDKIQLFSRDGTFIKRIDKPEDGISHFQGLTIISYYPKRIAVTNHRDKSIKIFDY